MITNPKDLMRTKDAEEKLTQIVIRYITDMLCLPQREMECDGANTGNTTEKKVIGQ